jgi:hypothetical protein
VWAMMYGRRSGKLQPESRIGALWARRIAWAPSPASREFFAGVFREAIDQLNGQPGNK